MTEEELKEAVDKFFQDTSRSREDTREALEAVVNHIEMLIETLH